jgi:outer membrane immunogenic protein
MRRLFLALISAVSVVAFTHIVSAADLYQPVYKAPPPAPPPVQDWSGIYVGLEGGYGWGKQNTDAISPGDPFSATITSPTIGPSTDPTFTLAPPLFFPDLAVPSVKQNGWLFGGFFGAQKQWGNWVLGIEGDIDGANIKGSGAANASSASSNPVTFLPVPVGSGPPQLFTCVPTTSPCFTLNHNASLDSKIDALASLRGKVGWSFAPDWLIYGTGGAAFARVENTFNSTESATILPPFTGTFVPCIGVPGPCTFSSNSNISHSGSGGTTLFGWAAGGGVDWKYQLDAGSALVFGVEYLHYGFSDQTITLSDNVGGIVAFRAKENVDAIKGRISYLFSIH